MNLRLKTHLIFAAILFCLAVLIFFSARHLMIARFNAIENAQMFSDIGRVNDAIELDLANLDSHVQDWGSWNDTYRFVIDRNKDYEVDNLSEFSLSVLKLNFIVFLDAANQVVASQGVDPARQVYQPIPAGLLEVLIPDSPLLTPSDLHAAKSGLLSLTDTLTLVASRQILTSEQKGPSHGTLVMGRLLDDSKIKELRKVTHLPLEVYRVSDPSLPKDVHDALARFTPQQHSQIALLGVDAIAGYALVDGVDGKPAAIFKIQLPREISRHVRDVMISLGLVLFLLGILFWGIMALLLERAVLARLLRLSRRLADIARSGNFSSRIEPEGVDEISAVTNVINDTVAALEVARTKVVEGELKYRTIFETTGAATAIVNGDGIILIVNAEFTRLAALPKGEIEGRMNWQDFVQEGNGLATEADATPSRVEEISRREHEFRDARGSRHVISYNIARIPNSDEFVIAVADVSDRKRIEGDLEESEDKYRTLVEQSQNAVFMLEGDRFIFVNQQFCDLTGYRLTELMGLPVGAIVHPEDRGLMASAMGIAAASDSMRKNFPMRLITHSGELRFIEVSLHEVMLRGRRVALGTFSDVTERHMAEEQLRAANEKLKALDRTKNEITSIVSHELRTPLGTIKQAIEILLADIDGPLTEQQKGRLVIARRNVERLVRLTGNVLDYSRLEAHRMEMHFEPCMLRELAIDVANLMRPAVEAKGLSFVLELAEGDLAVVCDNDRIRQVLINFIDNATKFTAQGSVTLRLTPTENGARIDIQDTGVGIRSEDLATIFEPFRQLRQQNHTASRGSGLGLSICKQIVEMHGGHIEVRSEETKGTNFSIFLLSAPPAKMP